MAESGLMTVQEVAALWRVDPASVYRAIDSGRVRAARIGRVWRVSREDAERVATPEDRSSRPGAGEKTTAAVRGFSGDRRELQLAPALGPGLRIFKRRTWETGTDGAADEAAGRARSAGKQKHPSAATNGR